MAEMVFCRACGEKIHQTALVCPHCGAPQRTGRYKSKIAAGLLAIFLGGLGIHRFYLGQWWGIVYLLLVWTWIPALVALIEGVVFLLTTDDKWDEKYNVGVSAGGGSSAALVVAFVLAGIAGLAMVGLLVAVAIPAYQDYTIKAKVQEGVALSSSHRTAVRIACQENSLQQDQPGQNLNFARPTDYSGTYVNSVVIEVRGTNKAEVVISYKAIGSVINEGETVVYSGSCKDGEITWTVGGTIPEKYLPAA